MKKYFAFTFLILTFALQIAAQAQFEAPDPSRNVPNGRVLGLGRAFTGLSEGTAAIFCNPAGLARARTWQVTSMSGKFLEEYSYLSFSGLYPTEFGNFGLGFMGSTVGGAYSTMKDPNSSDDDPVYIIDPSQPPINYYSNVSILTYAQKLARFFDRYGWEDKVALGANLKLFQSGLSGDGITQGSASGVEVDLGVLTDTPWPCLSLGLTLQNVLPSSMGGRLKYESGHEESYPAVVELGAALNLLGKYDSIRTLGDHEVKLLLDYYYHPTLSLPGTLHFGAEYRPMPMITLRAGLDQDVMGDGLGTGVGTVGNLTGGVGFQLAGFSFDYAYHSFAGVNELSNNYISISYSPPVTEVKKQATKPIVVLGPPDKLVTFEAAVTVEGQVMDDRIKYVTVGGLAPKLGLRGDFAREQALKEGRNIFGVAGFSADRKEVYAVKLRAFRLTPFPDVPRDYWVAQPISLLAMQKIITGYPSGLFAPEGKITRAEMCSLLMKTKSEILNPKSETNSKFKDVNSKHWAASFIAKASELGVVKGYPGDLFKPNGKITRAEGLAMVARFDGISEEAYEYEFPDIERDHWIARTVAGAAKAGVLAFLKGKKFDPNKQLTRAETVEMLRQTRTVKDMLAKDLLNWESY